MIDSIKTHYNEIDPLTAIKTAVLWLFSAPFYGLGWLVGKIVSMFVWAWAAMKAGYLQGRGG